MNPVEGFDFLGVAGAPPSPSAAQTPPQPKIEGFDVVGPAPDNQFSVVSRRDPTADEIRASQANPDYQPSYGDAKILEADEQSRPATERLAQASKAVGNAAVGTVKSLWHHGVGAAKEIGSELSPSQISDGSLAKLLTTGGEAAARGALDLMYPFYRGERSIADRLSSADPVALRLSRMMEDANFQRARQGLEQGTQAPITAPGDLSRPAADRLVMNNAAEFGGETVLNPLALAPGGSFLKSAAKAGENVAAKTGESLLTRGANKVADIAGKTAELAVKPGQMVKKIVDATLPETGAGSVAASTPTAFGASVAAPAKVLQKAAEVASQVGRTTGQSSAGRLAQIAMSDSAPEWIRGAARHLSRLGVDDALAFGADNLKSAAHGAAFGAVLSVPGAENAEEVGSGIGSGATYGSLAHVALSPAAGGMKYRAAQDADIVRWYGNKPPEEQAAINALNLKREDAIKLMTAEHVANGFLDPNANVRFEYQDPKTFEATYGAQRGVAIVQSDRPTIIFNAGRLKTGTAYHELFHALSRSSDIVDYGALTSKLLGVHDEAGNVVKPGLLSTPDLAKIGDLYYSRLDPIGQKSVEAEKTAFDTNPGSREAAAWTKRIVNEVGAELFSNLARDTKGSLLDAVDKPTLLLLDSMTRGDRAQWVQNLGTKLQNVFGSAPKSESDIFPGLKANPEIHAMMRDFVRNKRNLTSTPEFSEDSAKPQIVINPRDALRTGGDEIVKKFPDNDNFAKDPTGQVMYSGGRPVLLTESEIRKVQTKRAEAMTQALGSVPDTGEAGVLRPSQTTPANVPAGAVPNPRAAKPSAFTGRWFSDAQMAALKALPDNMLTPSMKAKLDSLNSLVRKGDGSPILLFYNAALKNRRYSSAIRETARVVSPVAMSITKAGNFIVTGLDVTAFNSKLHRWLNDKPAAFADFGGSADKFVEKTQQYLDNHQKGLPGATNLDTDAAKAQSMAYRINDFINIQDIASASRNPDRLSNTNDKDSLIRSFRFDRMNRIEPASGDKFPVNYELQKQVFSPDSDNFKAWFGDSKVVDEQGKPKVVYHGANRIDRVTPVIHKNRTQSGPMPYFTDDPSIASSYADGKPDESIEDSAHIVSVRVPGEKKPVRLEQAWYRFPEAERQRLSDVLGKVEEQGYYQEGAGTGEYVVGKGPSSEEHWKQLLRESRGNAFEAARELWINSGLIFGNESEFEKVLKAVGVDATVDDPRSPRAGILPAYLAVKNPLNTDNISPDVIQSLERASRRARAGNENGPWKNAQDPRQWVEDLKKNLSSGSYAWTSIPDWATKTLKDLGYDGIQDRGGKGGGPAHGVWVPFEPSQVKSPLQ